MRIEDLSVNERILIHLKDYSTDPANEGAQLGQTQEGIGEAVGIRINHVPRATNTLLGHEYIGEALVHVGGLKRKRKAFFLTPRGAEIAEGLISKLKAQKVQFRDSAGSEKTLPVHEILFRARGSTASCLILACFRDGLILESSLSGLQTTPFLSTLPELPANEAFVDREKETAFLVSGIESCEPLLVVSGIKGIGKTQLVLRTLKRFEGHKNIFWYTLREWDTVRNLLEQMAANNVRLGRNELRKFLRQTKNIDTGMAATSLLKDLRESDSIIVLDNIFDLKRELMQLLYLICEQSRTLKDVCAILITRDRQSLSPTACLGTLGPNDLVLKGLDRKSSLELLSILGMDPQDMDRVFAMTQGHPLALKLVNSEEIVSLIDTKGLTKEELWVVRCLKAFDAIFE
jgi:hypothetical protein